MIGIWNLTHQTPDPETPKPNPYKPQETPNPKTGSTRKPSEQSTKSNPEHGEVFSRTLISPESQTEEMSV